MYRYMPALCLSTAWVEMYLTALALSALPDFASEVIKTQIRQQDTQKCCVLFDVDHLSGAGESGEGPDAAALSPEAFPSSLQVLASVVRLTVVVMTTAAAYSINVLFLECVLFMSLNQKDC